jgi:hypothetical protein
MKYKFSYLQCRSKCYYCFTYLKLIFHWAVTVSYGEDKYEIKRIYIIKGSIKDREIKK